MDPVLDRIIYKFNGTEDFTVRNACEGVQIFGGIGSGKTSGSGEELARSFLRAGFGGLVLCAKKDVLADWQRYARETGRSKHLLIFDASGKYVFPFLQYEIDRAGEGAGYTDNLVRLFTTIYETLDPSALGDHSDPYWLRTMQQLLRNAIDLCLIARGKVSIPLIAAIIDTAATSNDEKKSPEWENMSTCAQLMREGQEKKLDKWKSHDFVSTLAYWYEEYPNIPDKTRSTIKSMLTSMMDIFLRSPFRMLFSEMPDDPRQIAYPELSHKGAIIILNLPIKEFGDAGKVAQVVYKYLWQQAAERREISKNTPPIFLWCDESQNFLTEYDTLFQATARSSRVCTVFLTQNLPNYYAQMGGSGAQDRVNALLGNLQTMIWHANSDPQTNEHAAKVIGQSWQTKMKTSESFGYNHFQLSNNYDQSFEYEVPPQIFTKLRKGSAQSDYTVEAVVFQSGRMWLNSKTYLLARFKQHAYG